MPRVRGSKYIDDQIKKSGGKFGHHFDNAVRIQNKEDVRGRYAKPDKLYHGSPYKIKKGQKLKPKGPTFYGFDRPGLSSASKKSHVTQYAKESDHGGINKTRHGKKLEPKIFAKKGYVYQFDAKSQKGWYKNYHGGHSEPNHWVSNKPQSFEKRSTVRFKGKVPITKGEAAGVVGAAAVSYGAYKGVKHIQNKRNAKTGTRSAKPSTIRKHGRVGRR